MRRVLNWLLAVALALTMSIGDAYGHPLPPGTPTLTGPLHPDDVLNRMDHLTSWIAYLQHRAALSDLEDLNGPYRSRRTRPRRAPAPVRPTASVQQWMPLIETYFAAEDHPWAVRVMQCESGGDPDAKNPHSSASGLFQHLARYWPERSMKAGWEGHSIFDPEANIAVAAWLFYTGGPSHWVCK